MSAPYFERYIRCGDRAGSSSTPYISSSYIDLTLKYLSEGLIQSAAGSYITTGTKERLTLYYDKASSTVRYPVSYQLLDTPNVATQRLESGLPVTTKLCDAEHSIVMTFQSISQEIVERLWVWFTYRISGEWETFYYVDPRSRTYSVRWTGDYPRTLKSGFSYDTSITLSVPVEDAYTLVSKTT